MPLIFQFIEFHVTEEFDLDFILKYATHFQDVIINVPTFDHIDAPTVLLTSSASVDRRHKASSVTLVNGKYTDINEGLTLCN